MISKEIKEKLSQLFATEQISKHVLSMGFNETCLASFWGFKHFGEGDDKLQHKQLLFPGFETPNDLQQKYNLPGFPICVAPSWQQITDWFRNEHDIDIDVIQIRQDPEFKFQYSVLYAGKLVDSSRTIEHFDAMDKAVMRAIEYKLSNS